MLIAACCRLCCVIAPVELIIELMHEFCVSVIFVDGVECSLLSTLLSFFGVSLDCDHFAEKVSSLSLVIQVFHS